MVTALYRRYRPETFAEMIGQSQVTDPLMTALRTDRVNHAYLFSGPRGCGKTTSARILARCLNCAEGPTDVPCGVCPSCVELARGGGGSLDVVEIDAASHNGVDDARDLRERAVFAPARDRYKIFILDEAHMVTPQGFNALLKLVEEPPEHVKFIFATTEPDKVLGTIRSRTHHYPFRLVPPGPMLEYVQQLCTEEGVEVAPGVLPLVVRAGGGSPRDTLSLLDQLIAGSEGTSIDYERAVALLGYTHGALLDEVVDAVGRGDAAGAFAAADRVVQTGQDPRRFVEDLLERLRDLIVVAASTPEAAAAVLRGVPADELARMSTQAAAFGAAELSRVADLVNQTLTEMSGATSPRLHLELMLARVLVPAIDDSQRGALARVERLERRVGVSDAAGVPGAAGSPGAPAAEARGADRTQAPPARSVAASRGGDAPAPGAAAASERRTSDSAEAREHAEPTRVDVTEAARALASEATVGAGEGSAPSEGAAEASAARVRPVGPVTLEQMRDAWPEVLASLQKVKRTAWMAALTAQVIEYRSEGDVLVLGFPSQNDVNDLKGSAGTQSPAELLRAAIAEVLGVQVKFLPRVIGTQGGGQGGAQVPSPAPSGSGSGSGSGAAPQSPDAPASPGAPASASHSAAAAPARGERSGGASSARSSSAGASAPHAPSAGGVSAGAPTAPASAPVSGPVDSWATVAIPRDEPSAEASAGSSTAVLTAVREAEAPAAEAPTPPAPAAPPVRSAPAPDPVQPDDLDAPPLDDEAPFDPDFDRAAPADEPGSASFAPTRSSAAVPAAAARAASAGPSGGGPSGAGPTEAGTAAAGVQAPPSGQAAPRRSKPATSTAHDGIQRYGEAVVREVLGATFLEEVEAPSRPGFGDRS
ncbi:DNA polymerase-3 subunit gamma/tau [Agromyces terreus]|uniref:DNA-directed DNA polymerase n=1 Tax=Agromyces terreus TaxID=424795 RepID=A0A9X2KAG3_9MICO|nr:DNA polymerase III subunit gamma and tau [Agromyces terreus]MCP2369519.1 DNA polymerase-3 subunit gamma/tau [Agromyces terreus]